MSTRIFPPLTSPTNFSYEKEPASAPVPVMVATEQTIAKPVIPEVINGPVTDADAEKAIRTLLQWSGDDLEREGLKNAPPRILRAWKEFFKGYKHDPKDFLKKTSINADQHKDMVCLENIRIDSFCEQELIPIQGEAFIAYIPGDTMAATADILQMVEAYACRLQTEEKLAGQIAKALVQALQPKGVAVAIRTDILTFSMAGAFETDIAKRAEFLTLVNR